MIRLRCVDVLTRLLTATLVALSFPGVLHKRRHPTDMDDQTVQQRRHELRKAVIELRARGLNAPAKWAAEQLNGLPNESDDEPKLETTENADETENDTYLLAKSYFDLKVQRQHQTAQCFVQRCCAQQLSPCCRNIAEWRMYCEAALATKPIFCAAIHCIWQERSVKSTPSMLAVSIPEGYAASASCQQGL